MQNVEMEMEMDLAVREERLSALRVLRLINLAEENNIHLERGYSSLHDWLITAHKYSEGAANRRVKAAKMIRFIPDAEEKILSGALSLTTLAMAYSFTKELSSHQKLEIMRQLENKSGREAERFLAEKFPAVPQRETVSAVTKEMARLSVNVPFETIDKLKAIRDQMSHRLLTIGEVIARLVAEKRCVTMRCSYQDPKTGRVCGGTFLPEKDHIQPKGLGGNNEPENLRPLCRAHNILMAEHAYGKDFMRQWTN